MLDDIAEAVKAIAQTEIMPRYLKVSHQRKPDGSVLTEADVRSQAALIPRLQTLADCPVLGEEMSAAEQQACWQQGTEGLWIIDPIDGTTNFVQGIPFFAVSVAFWQQGQPQLGVIYDPNRDELFTAQHGRGAWLNGEPLPLRDTEDTVRESVAGIDLKRLPARLAAALATQPPFASQRNLGASTLEWCYAATGRFDIYLHGRQKLWDYAAGALILREAGGQMGSLAHPDFWTAPLWERSVIAALKPALFQEWQSWLTRQLAG